jgi:fructose-bisphosphate aldolase class II
MRQCKHYTPIEHLIIYNSSLNEEQTRSAVERGRRVLNNIPGVRATWSGESVVENAKYRWCWLIRFANESVISFYRDHPDHVAYANEQFRPMADDRISIDYVLYGPE